jgi:hypothetical protein
MIEKVIKKIDENLKSEMEFSGFMIINNGAEPHMISSLELGNITSGRFKSAEQEGKYIETISLIKDHLGYIPNFYSVESQRAFPEGRPEISTYPVNFFNEKKHSY